MTRYIAATLAAALGLAAHAADPTPTERGLKLALSGNYEESEKVLKSATGPGDDKYHFARLLNNFATNNKAEADRHAKALEDSFTANELPTRYKALVYMMTEDLRHWKANDLGDIGRDMRVSGDRLDKAYGGQKTQDVQKEIVTKLDRLIKEQEDKANAGAGQGKDQADGKKPPGQSQGQGQPAPDSKVMGGSGQGKVDDRKLREVAENWGTLPPARRAAIVQEITRDLPAKYRPMIEEYFKALNRMDRK